MLGVREIWSFAFFLNILVLGLAFAFAFGLPFGQPFALAFVLGCTTPVLVACPSPGSWPLVGSAEQNPPAAGPVVGGSGPGGALPYFLWCDFFVVIACNIGGRYNFEFLISKKAV